VFCVVVKFVTKGRIPTRRFVRMKTLGTPDIVSRLSDFPHDLLICTRHRNGDHPLNTHGARFGEGVLELLVI
jgi:hypothetical protein